MRFVSRGIGGGADKVPQITHMPSECIVTAGMLGYQGCLLQLRHWLYCFVRVKTVERVAWVRATLRNVWDICLGMFLFSGHRGHVIFEFMDFIAENHLIDKLENFEQNQIFASRFCLVNPMLFRPVDIEDSSIILLFARHFYNAYEISKQHRDYWHNAALDKIRGDKD